MEITELINTDTVKLTVIPGLIVIMVLFFWFRRSSPKIAPRAREQQRGRIDGDPLLDESVTLLEDPLSESRHAIDGVDDVVVVKRNPPRNKPYEQPREKLPEVAPTVEAKVARLVAPAFSEEGVGPVTIRSAADVVPVRTVKPADVAKQSAPTASQAESADVANSLRQPGKESEQDLMLVLNVVANGRQLRGPTVLKAVTAAGLTFGKMGIFHYYAPARGNGKPVFSLASMVEPGFFNLNTLEELSTPGLTLFAQVSRPDEAQATFNAMMDTARRLADALHCTVCDERRGTLSKQGIEHINARIQDFQRRSRLAQAAHA